MVTRKDMFALGAGMVAGGAIALILGMKFFPQYVSPSLVLIEMVLMVVGVVLMIKNIEPRVGGS